MFELHPRLKTDTFPVLKLEVSRLYLMNDKRYPWVILVPERAGLTELHKMTPDDYTTLMQEIRVVSHAMEECFAPKKMNVGALGNMVPQLHIHIIARNETDDAWPGPVWGHGQAQPYNSHEHENRVNQLIKTLDKNN